MKKRVLSLILVLSILVGSFICMDVSAASTSSNTDVELIQATVVPDEWGTGFSNFKSDKTLVPVFSGGPIGNSPGNYSLAVFIVGRLTGTDSHWTLANSSGQPLVFRMNMGWDSAATLGSQYYATLNTDATGKVTYAQLPKTADGHTRGLSAEQLQKYTSDVDTFTEIAMLAKDLNARVEFRIWEKTNSSYTLNNYVQSIWESNNGTTYLKAKSGLKVDEYGGYQTSGTRDSAGCPIVFTDSAFQMTEAMFIAEDGVLRVSFNKVVQYGGRGNYCVNGRMAVVNEKGEIATDSNSVALSYSLPFETVCPWSAPSTVYSYKMSATDISAYNNLKAETQALNAKNDGHTYKLVYELEEINSQVLATRGEGTYNHFVDSIWADGYYPLMANASSKTAGIPDTAMQEIDYVEVDPQVKPSQCAKILSVTAEDIYSYDLTVTFDRPMNVDSVSLSMTYKADPSLSDVGYWQSGFYDFEYVTSGEGVVYKEVDGEKFSNKVIYKFTQPMDHYYIPEGAGIRFMEYNNCEGAEKNNGIINPAYAHDEYGRGLFANVTGAGGFDLAWQTVSMESYSDILLAATRTEEGKVALNFLYPVKITDSSKITVNGNAIDSATADNGEEYCTSWIIACSEVEGAVDIGAGALECAYKGTDIPALTANVNNIVNNGTDFSSEFTENEEYSFMNADTGREIILGTETDFAIVKANGTNLWYLKNDEGKYLDLTGVSAKATDTPVEYLMVKGENSRYQLVRDNGAVSDSDNNSDISASLTMTHVSDKLINSGWYITKKGETKPLKVLPIGDSNVYGTNPDLPAGQPQTGYRVELSQKLTEYFGRVVFVGNRKNETTTINSTRLNRHSGYPGYVVIDEWNLGGIGIQPLTDAIMSKYTPDIVIMSIGGNDCAYIAGNPPTDANMNMILTNYENYIKQVEAYLGENGIVLCNTMIPNTQANSVDITKQLFTEKITELVQTLSDEGYDMALGDNRSVLVEGIENGDDIMSSDKVHLSVNGSSVLANNWYKIITSVYGSDSIKKEYNVTFEGEGYTVISSDNDENIEPGNSYSFKIDVKDGYNGTPEIIADGLTEENGIYSFKNMLCNKTVSVRDLALASYNITVSASQGGSATPSATVAHGEDYTVNITPDTGYIVDDVKVDGTSVGAVSKYEFSDVTATHTVEVTFKKSSVNVDYSKVEHATVKVEPVSVFYGDRVKITLIPDEGYEITELIVNGDSKGAVKEVVIDRATENIEIDAKLVLKKLNVTVKVTEGGKANIENKVVDYGTELEIKATPDEGYKLSTIEVNDVVVTDTTIKITEDVEIEITFEKLPEEDNKEEEKPEEDKKEEIKNEEEKKEEQKAPATGDINIALLLLTAVVSLLGVAICIKKKYSK